MINDYPPTRNDCRGIIVACMCIRELLPLDGCGWLRREVVAYAVHVRNLCEDTVGDPEEHRPLDLLDACCHRVDGVDGADDDRPVI